MNASIACFRSPRQLWAPLAVALLLLIATGMSPLDASARSTTSPLDCAPVSGTFIDAMGATGTFEGCFSGKQLVVDSNRLVLHGALSMELRDRSGRSFATLDGLVTLPVSHLDASRGAYQVSLAPSQIVVAGLQANVEAIDVELSTAVSSSDFQTDAGRGWTCGLPGA